MDLPANVLLEQKHRTYIVTIKVDRGVALALWTPTSAWAASALGPESESTEWPLRPHGKQTKVGAESDSASMVEKESPERQVPACRSRADLRLQKYWCTQYFVHVLVSLGFQPQTSGPQSSFFARVRRLVDRPRGVGSAAELASQLGCRAQNSLALPCAFEIRTLLWFGRGCSGLGTLVWML